MNQNQIRVFVTFISLLVTSGCFHTVRDTPSGREETTTGLFFGSSTYTSKEEFRKCVARMTARPEGLQLTPMTLAEAELFCKNWSEGIPDQEPTLICGQNTTCPTNVRSGSQKVKLSGWGDRFAEPLPYDRRDKYRRSWRSRRDVGYMYDDLSPGSRIGITTDTTGWGEKETTKADTTKQTHEPAATSEDIKTLTESVDGLYQEVDKLKKQTPTQEEGGK